MNHRLSLHHHLYRPAGFLYLEVLVAIAVATACLLPTMEALRGSLGVMSIAEAMDMDAYALLAKSEEVLKEGTTALDAAATVAGSPTTPTSYSDTVTLADGRQLIRNVYIWPMDGDNADLDLNLFTGTDPGIWYVKVAIADTSLAYETIAARR